MKNLTLSTLLKYIAIAGNVLFILWVTYNGIDEGFQGTLVQKASYIALVLLLVLDTALILKQNINGFIREDRLNRRYLRSIFVQLKKMWLYFNPPSLDR